MTPARPRIAPMLAVCDLDRSITFYRGALGATVVSRLAHYALLDLGTAHLHLALAGAAPEDRPQVALAPTAGDRRAGLIVVDVDDCTRAAAEMVAAGARPLSEPTVPPWGGERRCFLLDPDDHVLELNEALPG